MGDMSKAEIICCRIMEIIFLQVKLQLGVLWELRMTDNYIPVLYETFSKSILAIVIYKGLAKVDLYFSVPPSFYSTLDFNGKWFVRPFHC